MKKLQHSMKSLRIKIMRPKICNFLAEDFKDLASFRKFTEFFKTRH